MAERLSLAPGMRLTRQREQVFEKVTALGGHVSADEVVAAIREEDPAFARSTVYRALGALAACGLLHAVRLNEAITRYEIASGDHQHAVCRHCDTVIHLSHEAVEQLEADLARRERFKAEETAVTVIGTCAGCYSRKSSSSTAAR